MSRTSSAALGVTVDGVTVAIAGTTICQEVSMEVAAGQMVGLVGPNGSGKTTVLRTMYHHLKPVRGAVFVGGDDVSTVKPRQLARSVAVASQEQHGDFDLRVRDVVMMGLTPYKRPFDRTTEEDYRRVDLALRQVGICDLAARQFGRISGGERQRAFLARALVQSASILILDEPTNHLDIGYQLDLLATVRRLDATVIIAIHDLDHAASFCDQIVVVHRGRIVSGGPPGDALTDDVVGDVFGVGVERVSLRGEQRLIFFPKEQTA